MVEAFVSAAVPGATEADCVLAALNRGAAGRLPARHPGGIGRAGRSLLVGPDALVGLEEAARGRRHIHPDMYGTVNGYFYDMVRTTVAGRTATPAQREVLEGSVAVVLRIVDGMRPGVSCGELFERGSSWLTEHGFEAPGAEASEGVAMLGQSYPSFGHSLGLAWENPSIVEGEQAVLEPNMVVAVEAEVGRPGAGTGAFEHNVLVTESGVEILTTHAENVWWD